MSEKIKHIRDAQKKTGSISDAIKRAKQHIRNVGAEDLQEPDGFASGDMKKFLEDPEAYEKDVEDEQSEEGK
ncbi:hypothetical protein R50072_34570 [Simiduia litorea]|uniref:Uncharacterized protein n=1 Tax=Halorubrum tibetense TaxID=175631 RepID=A0ABD5SDX8_9EURY